MGKFLEYYVVDKIGKNEFNHEVTLMHKAGWQCQGGVQVQLNADESITYYQAMTRMKYEEDLF